MSARLSRKLGTCLMLGVLAAAMPQARAWAIDLQSVLDNTTVTPPARVDFTEQRHNRLLAEPLVLTGYLEYLGPGVLRKTVATPFAESFLIEDGQILIERGGETRRLSLRRAKTLQTLLEAIEAILSGRVDKIRSVFSFELAGTEESWSALLTPISPRIAKNMTLIQIYGDDRNVTSIRIDLPEGEWHLMTILHDDLEQ